MKNLYCAVEKAEMPQAVGAELNTGGVHVTALGLALAPRPTWVSTVTVTIVDRKVVKNKSKTIHQENISSTILD